MSKKRELVISLTKKAFQSGGKDKGHAVFLSDFGLLPKCLEIIGFVRLETYRENRPSC